VNTQFNELKAMKSFLSFKWWRNHGAGGGGLRRAQPYHPEFELTEFLNQNK